MPFTPYHFGPSGFFALLFRKHLDNPVFMLANVIIDIEVLVFGHHFYTHTLLLGAATGALWAAAAYPLRHLFKKIMQIFLLPYQTNLWKMIISGVLGIWLHVIIDGIYHWDIRVLWPGSSKPLYGFISRENIEIICLCFFVPAIILYVFAAMSYIKRNSGKQN
jgi:membrane-bound metal-dependent hydrolase YbcI (DUF457 family)